MDVSSYFLFIDSFLVNFYVYAPSKLLCYFTYVLYNFLTCILPLPENGILPCARIFAVCIISGTRRRPPLPCVARRTHGKEKTHGKPYSSPCAKGQHTANLDLRRVSASRHTANMDHVRGTPFCRQGASRPLLFAVCQG